MIKTLVFWYENHLIYPVSPQMELASERRTKRSVGNSERLRAYLTRQQEEGLRNREFPSFRSSKWILLSSFSTHDQ